MGDMDIGEMFLNFILHEYMQALCGVDLTEVFEAVDLIFCQKHLLWERWVCCTMGLKYLPYQAIQAMLVAKEVIMGERSDATNVFCWDIV